MDKRHALGGVVALLLVAACGQGAEGESPSETPSATAVPVATGNGAIIVTSEAETTKTLIRYPIASDGSLGQAIDILTDEASFDEFPAAIDGFDDVLATGDLSEYWTTRITARDASTGAERSTVEAPQWCGGEGLTYNPCVLLDGTRLLRTSTLGGEEPVAATLTINSLTDGAEIKTLGPFEGLTNILGTTDPNIVLITAADEPLGNPPEPRAGTVSRLDVTSGVATEIGDHDANFTPVCAIGTDSVLGYDASGGYPARVIGPATIGDVTFSEEEAIAGCSADGRFVYLQHIPAPPTSEEDDEAPNPATSIERVSLADGSRESVQALESGIWVQLVTR